MNSKYLVNREFDKAIERYIILKKMCDLDNCNDYLINLINCLVFVYSELDIINPHILKDNKGLIANLTKYGMPKQDVDDFLGELTAINDKSMISIVKFIVDMLFYKNKIIIVSDADKLKFLNMAKRICRISDYEELTKYFANRFLQITPEEEIEFLEPELISKDMGHEFQFSFANGYISLISILVIIALVCFGITIVNIIVG